MKMHGGGEEIIIIIIIIIVVVSYCFPVTLIVICNNYAVSIMISSLHFSHISVLVEGVFRRQLGGPQLLIFRHACPASAFIAAVSITWVLMYQTTRGVVFQVTVLSHREQSNLTAEN